MAKQEGDAYPDPRRKLKALVCISLLLICLCSFIAAVAAPGDDLPDPRMAPGPIFDGNPIAELPAGNPLTMTQMFVIE